MIVFLTWKNDQWSSNNHNLFGRWNGMHECYTESLIQLGHQGTGISTEVFIIVHEKVINFIS